MSIKMEMIAWECVAESPLQRLLLVKFGDASSDYVSEINLSEQRIRDLSFLCVASENEVREQIQELKRKGIIFPSASERDNKPCWCIDFNAVRRVLGGRR